VHATFHRRDAFVDCAPIMFGIAARFGHACRNGVDMSGQRLDAIL
jgi:hypothetical protein